MAAVSSLVRSEAGRTWEGLAVPDDIVVVVLDMAARVYRNPANMAQESLGSWSGTYAPGALAGLAFTAAERRILGRYRTQRGLWTMGTTRNDGFGDDVFVPVVDAPPFPWYSTLDAP